MITVGSNPQTKALEWAINVPARIGVPEPIAPSIEALREGWRARRERLSLALVAVPLAETATGLTGHWWAWPVLLTGAWACTRTWKWTWLLSAELGAVGVMWATVGAMALADTGGRLMVGILWAAFPLALAGASYYNRRRHARPEAYFPLR